METPKDVIIEYSEGNGSANSDIDSRSAPSGTDLSSVIQPDIAQIDQLLSHFKAEIANNGAESVLLDRLIADGTLERYAFSCSSQIANINVQNNRCNHCARPK